MNNTKINTFLAAIIVALCFIIGVLSYFVFNNEPSKEQPDIGKASTAAPIAEPEQAKLVPKRKIADKRDGPVYVWGQDDEPKAQKENNITVIKGTSTGSMMIGNLSSGIYHYPNCSGVAKMNSKNKVEFETEDQAKTNGYRLHIGCPTND